MISQLSSLFTSAKEISERERAGLCVPAPLMHPPGLLSLLLPNLMKDRVLFLNFAMLLISFSIPVIVADDSTVGVHNASFTTKHVCRSKCGNLTVPYPFGIMSGSACSMNPSFDIICDESSDPPKAFLGSLFGRIMVSGIYETTIHIKNQPARTCYNNGEITAVEAFGMNFSGTPFSFSDENKLTAVGCNDAAFILKMPNSNSRVNGVNQPIASCVAICSEYGFLSNGFCSGSGCCQASIPKGVQSIYYHMETLRGCDDEHDNISTCNYSFLAEPDSYTFNISDIVDPSFLEKIKEQVPIVLDWTIDNRTCNQCANTGEMMCQRHSVCVDSDSPLGGYHCNCSHGYQGNPYLSPGCCWTLSGTRMISQLSSPFTCLKSALLLISLSILGIVADDSNVAKPGCPSTCGNLTVPYPFGIGLGSSCSINPSYDIICDESSDPPQAFLSSGSGNILVIGIYETTIHIKNQPARICYDHNKITAKDGFGISILGTPFSFSNENKLTVVGCDEAAFILRSPGHAPLRSGANEFISSCVAICSKHEDLSDGFCSGIGCCQASIPEGVQSIYSFMMNLYEHIKDHNDSSCSYSFLAEQNSYTFNISDISDPSFHNKVTESVPIVLDWVISNQTCNQTGNTGELLCQRHSECVDSGSTLGGYHCNCSQGYQGNPYLTPGCRSTTFWHRLFLYLRIFVKSRKK